MILSRYFFSFSFSFSSYFSSGLSYRNLFLIQQILMLNLCWLISPLSYSADDQKNTTGQAPLSATQVTVVTAKTVNWTVSVAAQGEIVPWEVVNVSAKTQGLGATEVSVVEGDNVAKGQVLARFDDRLLRAELTQARANLAFAQADMQLANSNLKRSESLKIKHTLSEQEFDVVVTRAATAAAARDQAAAAVTVAEIKLSDAILVAPDAGKILERDINLGQVPPAGAALFRLMRHNKLEWLAQVDAQLLPLITPGMAAEISVNTLRPEQPSVLTGKVRSVSTQLTKNSRLANVRVAIDGAPALAVNSYVEGKILQGSADAIAVPANCLVIKDGKTWLFRLSNNSAEQVLVSIGRRHTDAIEITSGIAKGDSIVQEGAGFLNHGDKVAVISKPVVPAGGVQ